jgi:hypothetical protein
MPEHISHIEQPGKTESLDAELSRLMRAEMEILFENIDTNTSKCYIY